MSDLIVFPDTLQWVVDYLEPTLAEFGYRARVSDTWRGDRVEVWLQRDGGPILDVVREVVRLRVNCYHDDPGEIDRFTQTVSALLMSCADGLPVQRVARPGGPIRVVPSIKPQTFMTFELTVRGAPLGG